MSRRTIYNKIVQSGSRIPDEIGASGNKLVVILGPTASGKTDLSIKLAFKFNGEIISADSRQVYKGLNIGSGKITQRQMRGIPHHLLDVANPKRRFTVAQFQKGALQAIEKVQARGHVPFLVGGTGLYIQSIVDGTVFPEVRPSRALRARLDKKSTAQLFLMLKKLDPVRAAGIDPKNPHRLIRAIEIVKTTGQPVPTFQHSQEYQNILQIGIKKSPEELKKAIQKRLRQRLKGMIIEVKKLHQSGLSWRRLEELGLEYRFVAQYIQKKTTLQEMMANIQKESEHFSKRQMTWFKRDKRIRWITNQKEAENLIKNLLTAPMQESFLNKNKK